jgi:hypothetical protein
MQANSTKTYVSETLDHNRIKRLVDDAAAKCHGFNKLAEVMDLSPKLISNWRTGVKVPSPEAQADLGQIAGRNAMVEGFMALIDKSTGYRRTRLQAAYREYTEAVSLQQHSAEALRKS